MNWGNTDSWRTQTKPCVHQDPGERNNDPTRDWARLACVCLGVCGGGMSWQWPAAGSGALTIAVLGGAACWHKSFWSRSPLPPLPLPKFGLRPIYREGTQPHPSAENWTKDSEHGFANQNKTQFSPQPVPPIRKLAPTSYSNPSEGRQNENHNHRKLTKLITWATTLPNSMKLWAMPCRATQNGQVMMESSDKMCSTGKGNCKPLQHAAEQYERTKRYDPERWCFQVSRCPICYRKRGEK